MKNRLDYCHKVDNRIVVRYRLRSPHNRKPDRLRIDELDGEDQTHLAAWYAAGDLSKPHYDSLRQWRDDGGGIERPKRKKTRTEPSPQQGIIENARKRFRKVRELMSQMNPSALFATEAFVFKDDPNQPLDLVRIGASFCYSEYFAGGRSGERLSGTAARAAKLKLGVVK